MNEIYVIVGFSVSKTKSTFYRQCKTLEELKKYVEIAIKMSDFISIRKVRT